MMRCKALLLLFVFLLNTATGFACVLHMSSHEHREATTHHHEGHEVDRYDEHRHVTQPSNHQSPVLNRTYSIAKTDPCCQETVNNFNTLAKVAPQSGDVILKAPFKYIVTYHQPFLKPLSGVKVNQLVSLNERQRPPTRPIRITIQSFQI